jgi:hypothetical protein
MKLTIIVDDKAVYVDGLAIFGFDMSPVPSNIHALQWKPNIGWLEFLETDDGTKPANEKITELPDWATALYNEWLVQKADLDARAAAAEAERLARQQTSVQ